MPITLSPNGLRVADVIRANLGNTSRAAYDAAAPGQLLRITGGEFAAIRAALASPTAAATTDTSYAATSQNGYAGGNVVAQGSHPDAPAFVAGHYPVLLRMRHDVAFSAVGQVLQLGASATGLGPGTALTAATVVTTSVASPGTDTFWVVRSQSLQVPAGVLIPRLKSIAGLMRTVQGVGATHWFGGGSDVTPSLTNSAVMTGSWQIITTATRQWV